MNIKKMVKTNLPIHQYYWLSVIIIPHDAMNMYIIGLTVGEDFDSLGTGNPPSLDDIIIDDAFPV